MPPSLSSSANCNSKQTQTLPTALNQAATTGMLTGPDFGLRALAAHSSGTDNGKFYLEVFVVAVLWVSPDSRFHLPASIPADWRRGWCVRRCWGLPAFVHRLERTFTVHCPVMHLLYVVALFLLEPCGIDTCHLLHLPLCTLRSRTCTPMTVHVTAVTRVTWGSPVDRESRQGNFLLPRL